jgi:hypothetical protein
MARGELSAAAAPLDSLRMRDHDCQASDDRTGDRPDQDGLKKWQRSRQCSPHTAIPAHGIA